MVGVLGTICIIGDDGGFDVVHGQLRVVLAILAANKNQTVHDDRLIDGIWDGFPPRTALANLRGFMSKLRKYLKPEIDIERRPSGYVLRLLPDQLDAARFEHLALCARHAAKSGDHIKANDLYRQALGFWRGQAFGDLATRPALQAEARQLDERRLLVLEEYFDSQLTLRRHSEIAAELYKVVVQNPFRDRLVAQLMTALYRSGRQSDALEIYEITRKAYADKLGLDPGQELKRLHTAVLMERQDLITVALGKLAGCG